MQKRELWLAVTFLLAGCLPAGHPMVAAPVERVYLKETIDGVAVCQLYVDGWGALSARQRAYAWHLSRAALAGRDIFWDQMQKNALEARILLEGIVARPGNTDPAVLVRIRGYLQQLYLDSSFYDGHTLHKHLAPFTAEELAAAMTAARVAGADLGVPQRDLGEDVAPLLFDPDFAPLLTARAPQGDQDIVQLSAVNFYQDVTLAEVEAFAPRFDLNSTLVEKDGQVVEEVWRTGDGHDHPAGRYARHLSKAIGELQQAHELADPEQARVLDDLIRYYQTGEYSDFRDCSIAWLQARPPVDTIMGFVEDYHDPRAKKGSYEGMVYIPAPELSRRMEAIAARVLALEKNEPWKEEYKKSEIHPPVALAIQAVIEVGDLAGRSSPVGINLPNQQEIRESFGAKSVYLVNADAAAQAVSLKAMTAEFALPEDREEILRYGARGWEAQVALHEIAGHASGKVSARLEKDPSSYLREYYSALEEARADLVALWNMGDTDLIAAGVVESAATRRAVYKQYVMRSLAQLRRAATGDSLGEDHLRAIQTIVEFARSRGAVERVVRDGKQYDRLVDEEQFHAACGELLSQLMAAKAEGDYDLAKALIGRYGVHFDPSLRDEVVARAKAAGVPSAFRFLSPRMVPVRDSCGKVIDATLDYSDSLEQSELRNSGRLPY